MPLSVDQALEILLFRTSDDPHLGHFPLFMSEDSWFQDTPQRLA